MERFTMKKLNNTSLDDFLKLPYFNPASGQTFNSIIIVPLSETHECGFSLMKFLLIDSGELVGVIGGYSDVMLFLVDSTYHSWSIDCLNQSKCIRIFTSAEWTASNGSTVIIEDSVKQDGVEDGVYGVDF